MSILQPQRGLEKIAPYVPGKPIQEVQRELGIKDVIKLASNENPLGPSPLGIKALQEALLNVHFYPDGESFDLRQGLAQHLGVAPQNIFVGNGADGVILVACMSYLEEGREVIVSEHSFPIYDIFTQAMRATLIKVPTINLGLDLKGMLRMINERTALAFICNPNNPTGTALHAEEIDWFVEQVPESTLIIFDEAYYEFAQEGDFPNTLNYIKEGRKNIMIMRTFSKAYGLAGLRVGYGIAHPDLLNPLWKVKEPFSVNFLGQYAALKALEDEEFVKKTIQTIKEGKEYLYQEFSRLSLNYVRSYTNFILTEVGPQAAQIANFLLQKGIIVRPCQGYGLPNYLRITVGTQAQNERLIKALEEAIKK